MTGFLTTRGGAPLTVAAALMALSLGAVRASAQTAGEWDVTVPRGETREIDFVTDEGTWMSVDISPDGEWIVFDLLGHVYRMPAGGGDAESLTQSSGIAVNYHPRISPDGSMIAFVSDRAGQENLWVMDADGTNPRPILLDDESRAAEPVWTPDGNHILMTRRQQTSVGFYRTSDELWRLPVDGGQGELLVRLDGEAGSAPARVGFWDGIDRAQWASVSDRGDYVYFNAAKFAGTDRHIRRIQLETGRIETVTEAKGRYAACCGRPAYPSHLGEAAPEISPDGRWLAFVRKLPGGKISWRGRQYQGRTALWVRDMETGAERILMDPVPNSLLEHHPAWATRAQPGYSWDREGRSIVLSQGGKIRRLWVESGQVETIPFQARVHRVIGEMPRGRFTIRDDTLEPRHVRWPVLSGDGRLVFETAGQLWIQEQAGAGPRPLVRQPGVGLPHTPTWSPDGQWVAYTTWSDTAGGRLWKVRPGEDPVELAGGPDTYVGPRWSADGASVTVGWRPAALDDRRWRTVSVPAAGGDAALAAPDATPRAPRGAERPAVSPGRIEDRLRVPVRSLRFPILGGGHPGGRGRGHDAPDPIRGRVSLVARRGDVGLQRAEAGVHLVGFVGDRRYRGGPGRAAPRHRSGVRPVPGGSCPHHGALRGSSGPGTSWSATDASRVWVTVVALPSTRRSMRLARPSCRGCSTSTPTTTSLAPGRFSRSATPPPRTSSPTV